MPQYGVAANDGISQYLKCYITQEDSNVTVVGYIGEGASKSLTSNWTSPFESDTAGKAAGLDKVADLAQVGTGKTLVNKFNSQMVWEGTTPPSLSLPLYFQARNNAKNEVDMAIMTLEQFASPELAAAVGMGRTPKPVKVNVGRRFVIVQALIMEVQSELDVPRTKDGYMTRNTVTLSLTPPQMMNASEIPNLYK